MVLFDSDFVKQLRRLAGVLRQPGDGIELVGHRDYSPGDDYRMVDWNICARHDELVSRQFQGEVDRHVYLLLDCSASMSLGKPTKFDAARRAAAALAYATLANLDRVGVTAFSDAAVSDIGPVRDKARILRLLAYLERLSPRPGETDLARVAADFVRRYQRHGQVVVLSDLYDTSGFQAGLDILRRGGYRLSVVQIYDPHEAEPDMLGDLELFDTEGNTSRRIVVTERHVRQYRKLFDEYQQSIRRYCAKYSLPCVQLRSNLPEGELLVKAIGGVRRTRQKTTTSKQTP